MAYYNRKEYPDWEEADDARCWQMDPQLGSCMNRDGDRQMLTDGIPEQERWVWEDPNAGRGTHWVWGDRAEQGRQMPGERMRQRMDNYEMEQSRRMMRAEDQMEQSPWMNEVDGWMEMDERQEQASGRSEKVYTEMPQNAGKVEDMHENPAEMIRSMPEATQGPAGMARSMPEASRGSAEMARSMPETARRPSEMMQSPTGVMQFPDEIEWIWQEEQLSEQDLRRLQSMFPEAARLLLPFIEEACDRMEYEGSPMFAERPDQETVRRISAEILRQAQDLFEAEKPELPDEMLSMQAVGGRKRAHGFRLDDLIRVLLLQEMHHRRCRHRRCRRW